jgi:dihydroorotase-like cyclic amidohydrolase
VTPYEGRELRGLVRKTYLRGRKIYDNGKITIPASGQQLLRLPAGAR